MFNHNVRAGQAVVEDDFYIEEWLIQPQLNRIVSKDETIQVQPKIMQVLVCLAEQSGKVVSRERLFQVVWAGISVTEHVLSRSISELRKIFGDNPRSPRVIETIPKTGYRLIAPVLRTRDTHTEDSSPVPASDASDASQASGASKINPPRRKWVSAGVLLRLLAFAAVVTLLLIYVINIFSGDRHHHFHPH
jgi:DNA-binding winged helix-turn-helix (wHTH) protein